MTEGSFLEIGGAMLRVDLCLQKRALNRTLPLTGLVNPVGVMVDSATKIQLEITTLCPSAISSCPWTIFTVDNSGNLIAKRTNGIDRAEVISTKFRRKVELIFSNRYGCFTALPSTNNLYAIGTDKAGRIEIWQAAVASRDGDFYGTLQKLFDYSAIWDKESESVKFPGVDWPQLVAWLTERFAGWQQGQDGVLPEVAPAVVLPVVHEKYARVLSWNLARGLGVVMTPSGDLVSVHFTEAPERLDGLQYLLPGELVDIDQLLVDRQTPGIRNYRKQGYKRKKPSVKLITIKDETVTTEMEEW